MAPISVAYQLLPTPDWAMTTSIAVPDAEAHTAEEWAHAIFDSRGLPAWVRALGAARTLVAKALQLPRANQQMLTVDRVIDGEAVIDTDDRHLRFVAGIRTEPGLVHVTTAVTLKGWRGKLYFAPVRVLHDPVTRSMMIAAASRINE
jgi:hypothetical protein